LRDIRIEIVLAVEFGEIGELCADGRADAENRLDRFLVYDRQGPGMAHAYRTYVRIRFSRERIVLAIAEHLSCGLELGMDLEADGCGIGLHRDGFSILAHALARLRFERAYPVLMIAPHSTKGIYLI